MLGLVSNSFGELSSSCALLGTCKLARTSLDIPVHHWLLLTPAATLSPKPVRGWGPAGCLGGVLSPGRERSNCVRRSPAPLTHVPELTWEQQVILRENTPSWLTAQLLASQSVFIVVQNFHRCQWNSVCRIGKVFNTLLSNFHWQKHFHIQWRYVLHTKSPSSITGICQKRVIILPQLAEEHFAYRKKGNRNNPFPSFLGKKNWVLISVAHKKS